MRVPFIWAALSRRRPCRRPTTRHGLRSTWRCCKPRAHGMYTVVDFHQDVYSEVYCGDGFPGWTVADAGPPPPRLPGLEPRVPRRPRRDGRLRQVLGRWIAGAGRVRRALGSHGGPLRGQARRPRLRGDQRALPGERQRGPLRGHDADGLPRRHGRADARGRAELARLRQSAGRRRREPVDDPDAPRGRRHRLRAALLPAAAPARGGPRRAVVELAARGGELGRARLRGRVRRLARRPDHAPLHDGRTSTPSTPWGSSGTEWEYSQSVDLGTPRPTAS